MDDVIDVNILILAAEKDSDAFALLSWDKEEVIASGKIIYFIWTPDWVIKWNHWFFVDNVNRLFQNFFRLTFDNDL